MAISFLMTNGFKMMTNVRLSFEQKIEKKLKTRSFVKMKIFLKGQHKNNKTEHALHSYAAR